MVDEWCSCKKSALTSLSSITIIMLLTKSSQQLCFRRHGASRREALPELARRASGPPPIKVYYSRDLALPMHAKHMEASIAPIPVQYESTATIKAVIGVEVGVCIGLLISYMISLTLIEDIKRRNRLETEHRMPP
jgi:hypothetical protein